MSSSFAELIAELPSAAVNAGVFVGMVMVTLLGWRFGDKKKEEASAVSVQEQFAEMMHQEAIKNNTEAMKALCDTLRRLDSSIESLRSDIRDRRNR
jgi:hypothetical protein